MMVITDGAGGMVDLKPEADTVQYRVNESLKGQAVTWEFALAQDELSMLGTIALTPDLGFDTSESFSEAEPGEVPHLHMIMLKSPTRAEGARGLKAGDRIIVQGTIGDASSNSGFMVHAYDGPVAIYHLSNVGHPAFWIGLADASITRAP